MTIVGSFLPLLQVFYLTMTEPTGRCFIELVTGWVFCPGRSLADRIVASGAERAEDAFYRLLSAGAWSFEQVSRRLLVWMVKTWPQAELFLAGDDVFLSHKGSKIYGTGMHRDPCLSTRNKAVKRWGHVFVVLSVVLRSQRDPSHYLALPVMVRLYLNENAAKKSRRTYRKKTDLMIAMLQEVRKVLPGQKLHFLGDYAYTAPDVLRRMPSGIEVTGRALLRARMYTPAPPPTGRRGRPRVRGERLPAPVELLKRRAARQRWTMGPGRTYHVRVVTQRGCFFQAPDRLVTLVAVEHLGKRRENEVFYSTVASADAEQIVQWYARRWSIETTFRDCKQHLGIGRARNRKKRAVERTAATGLLLYSLIVLWYERHSEEALYVRNRPDKQHASFADKLAALRQKSLAQHWEKNISTFPIPPALQKNLQYLENLLLLAA